MVTSQDNTPFLHFQTSKVRPVLLLSNKKECNNAICRDVDGPRDCHNEWSKSGREGQIPYAITYMSNFLKMVQMSLFTKQKDTDIENKLTVMREEGGMRDKLGDWD